MFISVISAFPSDAFIISSDLDDDVTYPGHYAHFGVSLANPDGGFIDLSKTTIKWYYLIPPENVFSEINNNGYIRRRVNTLFGQSLRNLAQVSGAGTLGLMLSNVTAEMNGAKFQIRIGNTQSRVATLNVITKSLYQSAPTVTPKGGTYTSPQTVTISHPATKYFYYTFDSSLPFSSYDQQANENIIFWNEYTEPIVISEDATLTVTAYLLKSNSYTPTANETYKITSSVEAPTVQPAGGIYSGPQSISIYSSMPAARYYYTLDGSDPAENSAQFLGGLEIPLSIQSPDITLNVMAFDPSANKTSVIVSERYRLFTVSASPAGGTYSSPQTVTLSSVIPEAEIHYTLANNPHTPTVYSPLYTEPVTISSTSILNAKAFYGSRDIIGSQMESYVMTEIYRFDENSGGGNDNSTENNNSTDGNTAKGSGGGGGCSMMSLFCLLLLFSAVCLFLIRTRKY